MQHNRVSILTGWGSRLGTGHIQRMASLAVFLNRTKKVPARIVCARRPDFLPSVPRRYFQSDFGSTEELLIRDMRDSDLEEMRELKEKGKVVAVDDCGPGRNLADAVVDLLPHPSLKKSNYKSFIYGYNFTESVRQLGKKKIAKDIDAAAYCGLDPEPETIDFFRSLVPAGRTLALLCGKESRIISHEKETLLTRSYAEIVMSAKVMITHFGIALYEGRLSGCRLACINPTNYHSQLTDIAGQDFAIENLGARDTLNHARALDKIEELIRNPLVGSLYPPELLDEIEAGLENFFSAIQPFLF